MNEISSLQQCQHIAAVERDTGLSKDTLRVWERRYGFPVPLRDENGDRAYPPDQVEKLRLIRRLLDLGMRPSKIVSASTEDLLAQVQASQPNETTPGAHEDNFLHLVKLHRSNELRSTLQQMLMKQGLQHFVAKTVDRLNVAIGQAWMRGELDIAEEHLYSEQLQNVLRSAIGSQSSAGSRPRVLMTTFPDELHGLGLLMAEAMLVPEGACCTSLGIQTPVSDIISAAQAGEFDVVALSFSGAFPLRHALDGLKELRQRLAEEITIWAGGAALQGKENRLDGIRVITSLPDALIALDEWRARHAN